MRIVLLVALLAFPAFAQSTNQPPVNVVAWGNDGSGQMEVPPDLSNAVAVAASEYACLALRRDGTVTAWGANAGGLPLNTSNAVAVAGGSEQNLILWADGTAFGWGCGNGECDLGSVSNAIAIAAGWFHTLVLKADSTVLAFGWNGLGQCNVPVGLSNVVALAGGYEHSLALTADHRVLAWGGDPRGQCDVPPNLTNVIAIAAGDSHSLALKNNGTIVAWGWNNSGQCNVPFDLTNVVALAAGYDYSMALTAEGTVVAWGGNYAGQCNVPIDLPHATAIAASASGASFAVVNVAPPRIFMSPQSQTAAIGSTVYLTVSAVGSLPLAYQWFFGGSPVPGATNSVLVLSSLLPSQAGAYTAAVTNSAGSDLSQPGMLSVLPALDVHMVPALTLIGATGCTYRLDYINAFGPVDNWSTLASVLITNQPQLYFDVSAIGQPQRFYRLVQAP